MDIIENTIAENTTQQPWVTVKIVDSEGAELMTFPATKIGSFVEDAEKVGLEIPASCCAWACFTCAGRIKSGEEFIDIGKISVPLIDIDEDQILMCIGWAAENAFLDGQPHEIVIEKEV